MQPVGLTFDEFVELKIKPRAAADAAFHQAARWSWGRCSR